MESLPEDPVILASVINTKLRDTYPEGLAALCEDMDIDRDKLIAKLGEAGFEYLPEANQFR